jgi:hypothetical protein
VGNLVSPDLRVSPDLQVVEKLPETSGNAQQIRINPKELQM